MVRKKKSDSQILERQRDLARERQRRRREKMSSEDKELKRAKDRERYAKLNKENKIKTVKDMTPREHRNIKKQWQDRKRKSNTKKKKKMIEAIASISPPNSEDEREESVKKRGRKSVRKDCSKAYCTIKKQEKEIKKLKNKVQTYKMRLIRAKITKPTLAKGESPSPKKKVTKLVGREKISPKVRKQLFLGYALQKQLKTQISATKPNSKRYQLITKAIGVNVLRKYRIQKHFKDIVSYKMTKKCHSKINLEYERKRKKCISHLYQKRVVEFYEDDTVSKCYPGKKDFVVKNKKKLQRRVLLDYKKRLYVRFLEESGIKMLYSTFCRLCPFWVTKPKFSDRETCGCIKHENIELKISALKKVHVIPQRKADEMLKSIVCDQKNEHCMMSVCDNCMDKKIIYKYEHDFRVKYYHLETVKEERVIKGKTKKITKTEKKKIFTDVSKLCTELTNDLITFKKHVYYAIHQPSKPKLLIKNLDHNEIIFRIDFSENYVGKHSTEIQSAHFGASKQQISLHTGVYYLKKDNLEVKSFCTVSDQLNHQAHAIWAHLDPILKNVGTKYPDTRSIHFYSDGPTNQYKNRYNIYLMKSKVPSYFKNVQSITWNYTEAGHGKGPMDGVGGVLKRIADEAVRYGNDITCARDFVKVLKDRTKIYMIEVERSSVDEFKRELQRTEVAPIEKITQARQITWACVIGTSSRMYIRKLSCFSCKADEYCDHYTIGRAFEKKNRTTKTNRVKKTKPVRKAVYHKIYSSSSESEDEHNGIENIKLPVNKKPMKIKFKPGAMKRLIKQESEPHLSIKKDSKDASDTHPHEKKTRTSKRLEDDDIEEILAANDI